MKMAPHIHTDFAASYTDLDAIVDQQECDCYHAYKPPGTKAPSGIKRFSRLLQESLPTWMGGPEFGTAEAGTRSLAEMLGLLKLTAETYLGVEVTNATVSVPFPVGFLRVTRKAFDVRLREAGSALNIKLSRAEHALNLVASQDRLWHRMKRSPYTYFSCHADEELLVLGVDFSDAALTATIQAWDCGDFWIARVLHSTELGARDLFRSNDSRRRLVDALHSVTALPVPGTYDHRTEDIDHIGRLIIMGDKAGDPRLHEALQEVFGEQYETLNASARNDGSPERDPLFLGAASSARSNWASTHYFNPEHFSCTAGDPPSWFWPWVGYHARKIRNTVHEWFRSTEDQQT